MSRRRTYEDGRAAAIKELSDALRDGVDDSTREQANARTPFGVAFIRVRGGRWYAVQSIKQWATVYREVSA